ncbi:MAG TPA: alkaline phosphatase D family protein [Actinomycetota bacterium]
MVRRLAFAGVVLGLVFQMVGPAAAGTSLEPGVFRYGVASGEVTPNSALLWTWSKHSPVRLDLSTTADFSSGVASQWIDVPLGHNHTVTTPVSSLSAATHYWFRYYDPVAARFSRVGTFVTPPSAGSDVDVHFAYTGDSDGWYNPATNKPAFNSFQTLDQIRYSQADFMMYLGDLIYSDSSYSPFGPADTVKEYRANYKQNRTYDALRDMEAALPVYTEWDDHEVRNDFDRSEVGNLFFRGMQAYEEYNPTPHWNPVLGYYRTFSWGQNLQFFILDERSFRSPEVAHFPKANPTDTSPCDNPVGSGNPDVAPTLPQPVRDQFSVVIPQLANPVPASCIAALYDPSRTMLGAPQLTQFESDLAASTAKFKLVFSEDPIQEIFAFPYDRWEGYGAERLAILNYITSNAISGVTWLTTDTHANIENDIYTNSYIGTDTGMDEAIVGPIATNTLAKEAIASTGSPLAALALQIFLNTPRASGGLQAKCAQIDTYAFGDVHYSVSTGKLTIDVRDASGNPICATLTEG